MGIDGATRHSEAGPGSFAEHSSKALAALVTLYQMLPDSVGSTSWLTTLLAEERIQIILKADIDNGDHIARGIFQAVGPMFAEEQGVFDE